jgi:protein SCO1/2
MISFAGRGRLASLSVLAIALLSLVLAACGGDGGGSNQTNNGDGGGTPTPIPVGTSKYDGATIQPVIPMPAATLTDTSGQPYDLQKQTSGYLTLLYLGYTHCPDACPTHMANIQAALKTLSPAQQAKVKVVFVTTDPKRDTPDVIRTWLNQFNSSFVGLTGSQAQLEKLQKDLLIPIAEAEAPDAQGNYGVGHAAYVMAFTNDNKVHIVYPDGMKVDDWKHDLPLLADGGWQGQ